MADIDRMRRRFLVTTALSGFGLSLGMPAAWAFSQRPMNAAEHKAFLSGCSGAVDPYHQQLAAETAAELKGKMSDAAIARAIDAMRCPICGCALVAQAPASAEAG